MAGEKGRKFASFVLLFGLLLLSPSAGAPLISIAQSQLQPQPQPAALEVAVTVAIGSEAIPYGGTGTVRISVSGVPEPGLKNVQVGPQGALTFDPAVVRLVDIHGVNSYIAYSHFPLARVNESGALGFTAAKFKPPFLTEGDIVELEFQALGKPGDTTELELTQFDLLRDADGNDLPYVVVPGRLIISPVPPEAQFAFSPSSPTTQDAVQFTDQSTDLDGTIVTWEWDFGDGTTSSVQHPTHRYADDGSYTVTLTVTDDDHLSDSTSKVITIANVGPRAAFTYSPRCPTIYDVVRFTDQSTDPDGEIVSWAWEFGDGASSTQPSPTHRYPAPGTYTVSLVLTDDDGASATTRKEIEVLPLRGDVNGDGLVNVIDVRLVKQFAHGLVELPPPSRRAADVAAPCGPPYDRTTITAEDARMIAQFAIGLVSEAQFECPSYCSP